MLKLTLLLHEMCPLTLNYMTSINLGHSVTYIVVQYTCIYNLTCYKYILYRIYFIWKILIYSEYFVQLIISDKIYTVDLKGLYIIIWDIFHFDDFYQEWIKTKDI